MKKAFSIVFLAVCVCVPLYADDGALLPDAAVSSAADDLPAQDKQARVNVDMELVYGQYGTMISSINLSREQPDFVYLLSSEFKRSNDYGYKGDTYANSSFYENKIGFTGSVNVSENWKSIFETEVNNDSRGMFENPYYSREEKDDVRLSFKNVGKLSPSFEGFVTSSFASYSHRLAAGQYASRDKSSLIFASMGTGGEYIWSAVNRIRGSVLWGYYNYNANNSPDNQYVQGQIIDDFSITKYFGISMGLNLDWDKSGRLLGWKVKNKTVPLNPIASITLKDMRYMSLVVLYQYDQRPFNPEKFYLGQKYIKPVYNLLPQNVHYGDHQA